jgi:hypothetical protein
MSCKLCEFADSTAAQLRVAWTMISDARSRSPALGQLCMQRRVFGAFEWQPLRMTAVSIFGARDPYVKSSEVLNGKHV